MRADRIKEKRLERGLTQDELANRLGISKQQVYRLEAGKHSPTADVLSRLAKELEVSMDYLFGLVDEPTGYLREEDLSPMERNVLSAYRSGDLREILRLLSKQEPNDQTVIAPDHVAVHGQTP